MEDVRLWASITSCSKCHRKYYCKVLVCVAHGRGRRRVISWSNKRNVIAVRVNFSEKGSQAHPMGSNPHLCGLDLSK